MKDQANWYINITENLLNFGTFVILKSIFYDLIRDICSWHNCSDLNNNISQSTMIEIKKRTW